MFQYIESHRDVEAVPGEILPGALAALHPQLEPPAAVFVVGIPSATPASAMPLCRQACPLCVPPVASVLCLPTAAGIPPRRRP